MSNLLYNIAREQFGDGVRSWSNNTLKLQLLSSSYVFDAAHISMDDVPVGSRILAAQELVSKSITDGYAVAAPVLFENASSGTQVTSLVIYYEDPSLIDTNHRLVYYADQVGGFPLTLDGTDQFFSGAGPNGAWFRI